MKGTVMIRMSNAPAQKRADGKSKQIKVVVSTAVYEQFKKFCAGLGQSVNKSLSLYIESVILKKPFKTVPLLYMETRPQRRKSLKILTSLICELREAESNYCDSIPENLRNGERYEQSEKSVDDMNAAIELLDDAF
jgi:hypothetical protein